MLRAELKVPGTQQMAIMAVSSHVNSHRLEPSFSDETFPMLGFSAQEQEVWR